MDKGKTYVVGFPRIGEKRELKKALEDYWNAKCDFHSVEETARQLRLRHWKLQKDSHVDFISSNDFSYYDGMLDTAIMLNAVPERFAGTEPAHEKYFAMARGNKNAAAMEMTKWLNTNYHYIVPELSPETCFSLNCDKILGEYAEALSCGIKTKINIIGPITFLLFSKRTDGKNTLELLDRILPLYAELFEKLSKLDDEVFVQMDEPALVRNPSAETLDSAIRCYSQLASKHCGIKIILMTYFDHACEAVKALKDVPLYAMGLDFICGEENITALQYLNGKKLVAGIVDGRNIWKNDYLKTLEILDTAKQKLGRDDVILSTSCSLLHSPYSLRFENKLDGEVKSWMSFACEKLTELSEIRDIWANADGSHLLLKANTETMSARKNSFRCARPGAVGEAKKAEREGSFDERSRIQKQVLNLPPLPTTTIGSFPQTEEIRKLRRDFKNGSITKEDYDRGIRREIDSCIVFQEKSGLDVLVHGEAERNDMVEYFGEMLEGFAFSENGWVQSYGSRCVKPPVIFGNVHRPKPMTLDTIKYAQSRTRKIMKGMLTGPVTILNWSFVRNDITRAEVCMQIASAINDEISDLQNAGIKIIQVDEAAFKERYPLRKEKISAYEDWAISAFKLAVSSAKTETQIHTHMCYSDFTDIMHTIEQMDADVITIETSRSGNKLLKTFDESGYKNEVGPGVYDIHSPRIPSEDELFTQINLLMEVLPADRLWINPDCGLKTRKWEEVEPSLKNMVEATKRIRSKLA